MNKINTIFDWLGGVLNAWTLYEKTKENGLFSFFRNIGKKNSIEAEKKTEEKANDEEIMTDKDIIDIAINHERNRKWLNWFLERHKELLPNFDYYHRFNKEKPTPQEKEIIEENFTLFEQKIIFCGLSHLYMLEKFYSCCLRDAPNLLLNDFQKLCFFWWTSEKKDYPLLVKKGQINEEQKKKLDKYLIEKKLKEVRKEVNESLDIFLEIYLEENKLPVPKWYFDYQKEEDVKKRAELYKNVDIRAKEFREDKIKKIKEFYKKNKDIHPELEKIIKEKIKEEREVIKNLEETIKTFDYLRWSESYISFF